MVAATKVEPSLEDSRRTAALGGSARRQEFFGAARALAREILDSRVVAKDGSLTWLRPNRSTEEGAPPLVPAGPHLYDGLPGISVFFAALSRVGADEEYRQLSLDLVSPLRLLLRRLVTDPERAGKMRLGIGGLVGVGSFVYSLATLGRILDLPDLIEEAYQVSGLITSEHVAADRSLDVVSGAPGAILALLTLARSNSPSLEVADWCADHLLNLRLDRPDGTTAWATDPRFPPVTGFAHGTTGICCALLKLYAQTGRRDLLPVVSRGWAFERSTFSQEHQDWIDQTSTKLRFLNQWCFGAPGITLGRLATLEQSDDEEVWKEIRAGLQVTSNLSLSKPDHICCGDMGRVDVLIYASDKLKEPDLMETACELARRVLARFEERGRFYGLVQGEHRDPSFFSGEAGIGYTLLRLAFPGELPCLLAME